MRERRRERHRRGVYSAASTTPTQRKMSNENVNVSSDKMSVFSDFQRMWVQRFPQSSLSDAWELDVRASLQRHKQKIDDLSKELEQETLYVEYLERLLSDVEKFREAGGDPSSVFDAANPTLAVQNKLKEVSDFIAFQMHL